LSAGAFGVEEESRERILTDDELRAYWRAHDLRHRPLLRFLLLTGLRIAEAQQAQLADIDNEQTLTIPAAVTKNGRAHHVYLAPLARKQIEKDAAPHLFRSMSPTAVQAGLHRWQKRHAQDDDRWTPHDLRRSFASRCGDLGIAPHVIAKLLNHSIPGSGSLPVYLRSEWLEERTQSASALAGHVATLLA
jgi:integrase